MQNSNAFKGLQHARGFAPRTPLTNEAIANQHFATLKDLDTALSARCCKLDATPEIIKADTRFAWWPAATAAN